MESSSMEVKVMSCRGLRAFNFFQKLCVYVMVSIACEDPSRKQKKRHHQQQKTPIDREGDGDPEWKHEMRFDLKEIQSSSSSSDHLFLEFDLLCEGTILGDKSIGKVRVPFKELIEEFSGAVRFVSYQVQSTDGKPNGVLDFAYKVIGKENKIGNGFTVIDDNNYPIVNPASSVSYPTVDVHNPSPAVYYPSSAEVQHPSMEDFYLGPPQPPPPPHPAEMMYYDYHLPPQPVYYPPPPAPYGYGGMGGYSNPQFGYPTVGQPHQPYGDTWHNGCQQREGSAGSWSLR